MKKTYIRKLFISLNIIIKYFNEFSSFIISMVLFPIDVLFSELTSLNFNNDMKYFIVSSNQFYDTFSYLKNKFVYLY